MIIFKIKVASMQMKLVTRESIRFDEKKSKRKVGGEIETGSVGVGVIRSFTTTSDEKEEALILCVVPHTYCYDRINQGGRRECGH